MVDGMRETTRVGRVGGHDMKEPPRLLSTAYRLPSCNEEQFRGGLGRHAQQKPAIGKTADVGGSIGPLAVPDRHLDDLQIQLGRPKQEVEITKGIQLSKIASAPRQLLIPGPPEDLGTAEAVLDRLADERAQEQGEKAIAQQVEEAHGLGVHSVNQAATIDELTFAADEGIVEVDEILRRHAGIRVQNHEDIALGLRETQPHCIALAPAFLNQ